MPLRGTVGIMKNSVRKRMPVLRTKLPAKPQVPQRIFRRRARSPRRRPLFHDQHRAANARRDTIAQVARYSVGMARKKTGNASARVLSSKEVYRGPVFWVTSDRVVERGISKYGVTSCGIRVGGGAGRG